MIKLTFAFSFQTSLNHYLWVGLEEIHSSLTSVRKSSQLLAATILTVTALHIPTSADTFDKCYDEFLSLVSSSMFSRYHSIDDVRGLCIAAFWLSDGMFFAAVLSDLLLICELNSILEAEWSLHPNCNRIENSPIFLQSTRRRQRTFSPCEALVHVVSFSCTQRKGHLLTFYIDMLWTIIFRSHMDAHL
jgi:hypothetical protein